MKALVLTSTGLRHRYFAWRISERFNVLAVLTEEKRNYYAKQREESPLIRDHFSAISDAEQEWFGDINGKQEQPRAMVEDINSRDCIDLALKNNVDVVCLFGTAILSAAWLEAFPSRIINLHLGLSPFYRGSATLFWPFANKELQFLGTTIHLATEKVDAGNIISRIDADLRLNEDYYAITSRLIRDSIDKFPDVVMDYLGRKIIAHPQETFQSRVCRKADFSESSLKHALDYVGSSLGSDEIARIMEAKKCRYLL